MERFAVIMAGGRGERLWPLSTPRRPKQFLPLVGGKSLFQLTLARINRLIPSENVLVVAPKEYAPLIEEQAALPEQNILFEPCGKSTAPCLALAAFVLSGRAKNAVMIALPADHIVRDVERFCTVLRVATQVAQRGESLVTLGIPPSFAATGYGYIRRGPLYGVWEGVSVYQALGFKEKPDAQTAEEYLASGEYYWNSGMFVWRVDVFLDALAQHLPELYAGLEALRPRFGAPNWEEALREFYEGLPAISVDYGVMEKARNVLVIPADIGWSDVGDWAALAELFPQDDAGNRVHAKHLGVETQGCVIYSARPGCLVVTLGLKDLVIVETEEVLMLLPKARAQEIRRILRALEQRGEGG